MTEQLQGRDVQVGENRVTVYDLSDNPNSWYNRVYQTKETRMLDKIFELTGNSVDNKSNTAHFLRLATGECSLGEIEVELVLSYFTSLAGQAGNFVGLPEDELRYRIRHGDRTRFSEGFVDLALRYEDFMNNGAVYLGRINVEGSNVLFPKNLKKLIF